MADYCEKLKISSRLTGPLRLSYTLILKFILLTVPVLVSVAFITLAERKVLSLIGIRQGPNKVSLQGILQPMSDAIKLANKRSNRLSNSSLFIYYISVLIIMVSAVTIWSALIFIERGVAWKFSMLTIMIILGISSIKAILAGWRTYGKYSLVGSMRTVSQIISYESILYLCLLIVIWLVKSFGVKDLNWQNIRNLSLLLPFLLIFWVPSILAELNRTPYDFSEGERELVRGFNTEFGSRSFTLIFLREYRNIIFFILFSTIILFFNEATFITILVFLILNYWIIWIRTTLPRMRFDKFMMTAWKFYIPFTTLIVLVIFSLI